MKSSEGESIVLKISRTDIVRTILKNIYSYPCPTYKFLKKNENQTLL
jgi:hypothetical protein